MNINKNKILSLFVAVLTMFMATKTTEGIKTEATKTDALLTAYQANNAAHEVLQKIKKDNEIAFNSFTQKLKILDKITENITKETDATKIESLKIELNKAETELKNCQALLTQEQVTILNAQYKYNTELAKAGYWSKFTYALSDASNATFTTVKQNPVTTLVSVIAGSYIVWSIIKALSNDQEENAEDNN
jgi:hypothetical protein